MLKLNLLPPNIYEPRKKRAWFAVFVVVWIALAGGLIAWQLSLVNLKSQKSEELQQQEAIVKQVEQTEQEAMNTKALVAPLLTRAQLADEIFRYNKQYPKLYREVRRWTIDSVRYGSLGVAQGMTLQAQAVTRDLDEMARYLQIMLQCPLFTGVSISWTTAGGTTTTTTAGGFGGMGAPPFGGGYGVPTTPYGAYGTGAPYGAPTGVPGMPGAPGARAGQLGQQRTAQGVVFNVVATLREPLMNQVQQLVQQLVSSLGGAGMTGMGGMGARMGLPGAPMMGAPGMGGPMFGAPPSMGGGMAPPMGPGMAGPMGAPGGMGGPRGGRGGAMAE
ncbi:MAG: PilN domain-containing protein [Armatimonadota bacterium]